MPCSRTAAVSVAPFGDGSTSRVPGRRVRRSVGDSDGAPSSRRPARIALDVEANAAACSSAQRAGITQAPASTAALTALVKRSTSTMTTTAAPGASAASPSGPHPKR